MRFIALAILCLWSWPVCAQPLEPEDSAKNHQVLKVVASITILADMVAQVGGDDVTVSALVGPNGDAHVFEPGPMDVGKIAGAGLVVTNGLGLEGWMTRLIQSSGYKGPVTVAAQDIKPRQFDEDGAKRTDPHAWQNITYGRTYVATIAKGLSAADPAHADHYAARAALYDKTLADLDLWVRDQMASVPQSKRQAITSHDAFGYFADAYQVRFLAPRGMNTESEPRAGNLAQLVKQIRSSGIKAVFLENMSETKSADMLVREAGAVIGGTLYVDALSKADGPAPTYEAMFRHNVPLLRDAMLQNK